MRLSASLASRRERRSPTSAQAPGYMTLRLSKRVGSNGVVYASDIQQPMLDILDQRLKSSRITNVQLCSRRS